MERTCGMLLKSDEIKKNMMDEESKILFDARMEYMRTGDADKFYNISDPLGKGWYCPELDTVLRKSDSEGIIIFGCGHDGIRNKRIMENCNYHPKFFVDSDSAKSGTMVDGIAVISVEELSQKYKEYLVVLGSARYAEEMHQSLLSKKFPEDKILRPQYGILIALCGNQYFDVFSVGEKEIFIDGGGYNGDTSLGFIDWTDGDYSKICVFEPFGEMFQYIKKRVKEKNLERIELYNNALWSRKESLHFLENDSGSHVVETGKVAIEGISLDEIVKEEKVTFIKMDIEGSELDALKGAQNVIKKNKPKLAICIYHKPEDILEIPAYILKLVPEYKFYIRHYTSCMWETVLYAEVL